MVNRTGVLLASLSLSLSLSVSLLLVLRLFLGFSSAIFLSSSDGGLISSGILSRSSNLIMRFGNVLGSLRPHLFFITSSGSPDLDSSIVPGIGVDFSKRAEASVTNFDSDRSSLKFSCPQEEHLWLNLPSPKPLPIKPVNLRAKISIPTFYSQSIELSLLFIVCFSAHSTGCPWNFIVRLAEWAFNCPRHGIFAVPPATFS